MRKGWLDPNRATLTEAFSEFRRRFPLLSIEKLNGSMMRQALAGDLIPVKMGGRQMFELWPREAVREHLKRWNLMVAAECQSIPPMKDPGDPKEMAALMDRLNIQGEIVLAGDGPRKFR